MPSKAKKHSKTLTTLSSYESQWTPSSSSHALDAEPTQMDFLCSLEEASAKYHSLIGKSAFIGQLTAVDDAFDHASKGFKIWLSKPSMVASSLTPGSIVSVSLPSLNSKLSNTFPLSSLADECARHFGIDPSDQLADEAGNYFALARTFPSNKVAKNQVRLSANLSNTMGCPSAGRVVFVYPAQSQLLAGLVSKGEKPNSSKVNHLLMYDCNEIILELIHSKNRLARSRTSMNISLEKSYAHSENEVPASLRTPLNQSSFSFSNFHQLNSSTAEDPAVSSTNSDGSSIDSFDIMEVLVDENSKRLMQTCATIWLHSSCLLRGNIVTIPMLSNLYSFHVIDAKRMFIDGTYDLTIGNKDYSEVLDHSNEAFLVNRETKVSISVPLKLASGNPKRRVDIECSDGEAYTGDTISHLGGLAYTGDTISHLGGLSKEYLLLKEIIVSSSRNILSRYGLQTIKGVLLHGPPGTGKTSLARLCARDAGVELFTVHGYEIGSPSYGEIEQSLHKVFDSARQVAPAVVFIDKLDVVAPAMNDGNEELSQLMVATLLKLMDGICRTEGILVIGATDKPHRIDPELRRRGRLDTEIEIGVPSPNERLDILQSLLSEMDHTLLEMQVQYLAGVTHGFVGADLVALCTEAVRVCLYRNVGSRNSYVHVSSIAYEECSDAVTESNCLKVRRNILGDSNFASSQVSHLAQNISSLHLQDTVSYNLHDIQTDIEEDSMVKVTFKDFEKAMMKVKPSAMQEVRLDIPKVKWEDVGGQREVKNQLIEVVEWPQKHQDAFNRIGSHPPTGVLLFGPPGCSKTLIARAVASEAGLNFFAVKGPELLSKWVGESEKAVRSLFAKARANAPSIIFFDEIDGLAAIRGKESDGSVSDRVISQLLVELDGLHGRVNGIVIAATNRPDRIDPALIRQGRFDRVLYVGPPNESDREEIFRIHLRKTPCNSDVSIRDLACLTEGFTGADISLICQQAAVAALKENLDACEIRMQHLKTAISQVHPADIQLFQALSSKFQRHVNSSGKE